jgi:Flp pilus assembly protein TadD
VNRRVPLWAGAAALVVVLAVALLVNRSAAAPDAVAAPANPHARVAGFEPSATNVSSAMRGRMRTLTNRVESDPADTSALLELARLLHDAHKPRDAARYYARYTALNPANREAWFDLADSYGRAGDWSDARAAMQSLLELHPGDPAALYNLGVIELQLGDAAGARTWWEKAAGQTKDTATARRARDAIAQPDQGR